ncbi:siderophore-interacting protein [Ignatzschineria sp. LJL83]
MPMIIHRTTVHLMRKTFLTPNYLRLILKCEDIEPFLDVPLGVNNKIFIPPQGHTDIEMPVFNAETKLWEISDESLRPTTRTYTHRAMNIEKKELTVDFAMHEGDSIACNWAKTANIGDQIGLAMKLKHRNILPENTQEFLFVTDMTGIPAVASLASKLPENSKAHIITEVLTPEDILEAHYHSQAELSTEWLINPTPEKSSELSSVSQKRWQTLTAPHFTHITAEYHTVKSLRDFLRHEQQQTSKEFYACAYWQIDTREDAEREKRLD